MTPDAILFLEKTDERPEELRVIPYGDLYLVQCRDPFPIKHSNPKRYRWITVSAHRTESEAVRRCRTYYDLE